MNAEQVLTLVLALSSAILTPGPSIIATIQTAFTHGRERALPYALGLACGASLWCLAALLGLAVVFELHPGWFSGLKIFGGFYLFWFAWKLWQAARQPLPPAAAGAKGFFGGIALNLSNPKPALFYAALLLKLFPPPLSGAHQAMLYGICLSTELFWYTVVAVLMSTATMRARYFAAKFWIDRAASVIMALLGLMLIIEH